MISRLDTKDLGFDQEFAALLLIPEEDRNDVRTSVRKILDEVKAGSDGALLRLTSTFDHFSVSDISELVVSPERLKAAYEGLDTLVRDALNESIERVTQYHEKQLAAFGNGQSWQYIDEWGNKLGQRVTPMQRVGIYAPGGKASYPSTVIMTAIPARVAGVAEVILCAPAPKGEVNNLLLAAAYRCGVDQVITIGGAQAIAAMAYGTETVARVDKIVGPGNIFVATAKEMVFGDVGIDMIAGPSEVVIVADSNADVEWIVLDMFAQAEHDEMAQAILISDSEALLDAVHAAMPAALEAQKRKKIIQDSISTRGALIKVTDLDEAFEIVNRIAPEHLQLAMAEPELHVQKVKHAGAVFLGMHSAEVVGDYTAGPSHVLPTSGTARFASALGTYDFQTRTSMVACSPNGSIKLNRAAAILATEEGLGAHAASASARARG